MTGRESLNGKPYAGSPHVRFDEGKAASTATSKRGSLLYIKLLVFLSFLVLWMRQAVAVVAPDSTDSIVPASTPVAYDEMTIPVVETRLCDEATGVAAIDTLTPISFMLTIR